MSTFGQTWKNFKWIWLLSGIAGLVAGLLFYAIYASRAWSYVSDQPAVCLNCHIMGPYYQSWEKSSHALRANCVDCHVPQDKVWRKYAFKAMDGLYHAAVFTAGSEPQVIRARVSSQKVILENCVRCHTPLVTEFVKMGADYEAMLRGDKKTCFDCHRNGPHDTKVSLSTDSVVGLPLPDSPAPAWLEALINKPQPTVH
jgi:cytochrome c nitrite reductase small subunit